MKNICKILIPLSFVFSIAAAQTPEPTATVAATATVTVTSTPSACANLQTCVDNAVPTVIASCGASNPGCTSAKTEKYAVSAGQLARRAVDTRKCKDKKVRAACNVCYQVAELPLRLRFQGDLFKGLLAHTVTLIEQERKATCPALPARSSK